MPESLKAPVRCRRMIRRLAGAAALLAATGCAVVESGGRVTYTAVPLLGEAYDRDVYNREGTSFYNPRWSFDPDSHPAVRPPSGGPAAATAGAYPPVSTRSAAEQRADGQVSGAIVGAI